MWAFPLSCWRVAISRYLPIQFSCAYTSSHPGSPVLTAVSGQQRRRTGHVHRRPWYSRKSNLPGAGALSSAVRPELGHFVLSPHLRHRPFRVAKEGWALITKGEGLVRIQQKMGRPQTQSLQRHFQARFHGELGHCLLDVQGIT